MKITHPIFAIFSSHRKKCVGFPNTPCCLLLRENAAIAGFSPKARVAKMFFSDRVLAELNNFHLLRITGRAWNARQEGR